MFQGHVAVLGGFRLQWQLLNSLENIYFFCVEKSLCFTFTNASKIYFIYIVKYLPLLCYPSFSKLLSVPVSIKFQTNYSYNAVVNKGFSALQYFDQKSGPLSTRCFAEK